MNFDAVSVTEWISAYGLIALFAVALMERFVPVIPSFGLLLAVGFAAAEGTWPLAVAFLVTVAGNILGATVCFYIFRRLDEARSTSLLNKSGSLFRVPALRIFRWVEALRRHQIILAFSLQLVPTVRLFAPALAGLIRSPTPGFLLASAAGIVSWNGFFISLGYFAQNWSTAAGMTALT